MVRGRVRALRKRGEGLLSDVKHEMYNSCKSSAMFGDNNIILLYICGRTLNVRGQALHLVQYYVAPRALQSKIMPSDMVSAQK